MSNFSFPPPPPPPPRAAAPSSQQSEPAQSIFRGGRGGGRGRGGGGGGGRGNSRGRGGGQNQRGGRQQQQQQHQNYPPLNHSQYGASVNGTSYGNFPQVPHSNPASYQQTPAIPPGAYVNPAFNPGQVQAETSGVQYGHQSYQQYGQHNSQFENHQNKSPSQGAQKRTLQQAFGGQTRPHPMKKPPSAPKVQAAPAVPSFGAPLPLPPKPAQSVTAAQPGGKKQNDKKRVSLFGLTPEGGLSTAVADEESGDEDVDEEANYAANLSTGPLTIEYNGETRSLTSAADIAEWVQERKRFFPTKARIEEKKTEVQMRMDERKRIQQETRAAAAAADPQSLLARSLPGKRERPQDVRNAERQKQQHEQRKQKGREQQSTQDDTRKQLEAKMLEVQELQKRLAESESKAASSAPIAADSIDLGDGATTIEPETKRAAAIEGVISEVSNPAKSSVEALQALEAALDTQPEQQQQQQQQQRNRPSTFPETTQTEPGPGAKVTQASPPTLQSSKSSPSSSSSSSSASDSDSDADSGPEQSSSKPTGPIKVAPPNSDRPICRAFAQHGRCNHANCKFRHISTEQTRQARNSETLARNGGRLDRDKQKQQERSSKSLFQRMVEQERDEENKLALAAIKFLGGVGFLRPQQQEEQQQEQQQQQE